MYSENNRKADSEMTELADLPAFKGLVFSGDLCQCGMHLAIVGEGLCTICMNSHDHERSELIEFDPEVSEAINGIGTFGV